MATTTLEQGDANGKTHKFKYAVDDATGALSPIVSDGAGTTTTLEQGDANGVAHKMKYQVDVDGVTLMPVVTGAAAGAVDGGLPPLTTARTVYVSLAGSDANPGTQALPFLTIARAWAERQKYGDVRALFKIKFIGAGPFTYTNLAGSWCTGNAGCVLIEGDETVENVHATGTFTGDFVSGTSSLNTSPGLGIDTHRGRFLRITSGNCVGVELLILEHTDAQIVSASGSFRSSIGAPIVAGDTFTIFTPATTLTCTFPNNRIQDLHGGAVAARHVFHGVVFSGAISNLGSEVVVASCIAAGGFYNSAGVSVTNTQDGLYLGLSKAGLWWSAGARVSTLSAPGYMAGNWFVDTTTSFGGSLGFCVAPLTGARFLGVVTINNGAVVTMAGNRFCFDASLDVLDNGYLRFSQATAGIKFAVVAGDCVRVRRGGLFVGVVQCTGGTTAPTGVAINVSGGGRAYLTIQPGWTGGTPGQDLKTTATATPVANATLAAVPSAVDALGSPYGEALCRVP